jgi:hypothetical protein
VAMAVDMGQGQALEGRPFNGLLLLRAGSLQDLALLEYPLLLRAGKVISGASGVAPGNTDCWELWLGLGVIWECKDRGVGIQEGL